MMPPEGKHFTARLRATPENLSAIRRIVDVYLGENEKTDDVKLVLTEAVSNAIRHGYDPGPGYVTVELRREGDVLCVGVQDDGCGLAGARAETRGAGLGLPLIEALTETMEISEPEGGGTTLQARFQLDASA
jgi:stage II sporulation protein AB (anti-sigma F factor)